MGTITMHTEGAVAVLTVDSPEVRNALTPEMATEMIAHCDAIDADPAIGAAVVRGANGTFSEELDGRRAAEIGLAWRAVADADVEATALELAARPARDPALAREAVRSFRTEAGPPGIEWRTAMHFERATQMWSQRRRPTA